MIQEGMRGEDQQQNHIFSYLSPEARVRKDHPLRAIRGMVDEVLNRPPFDCAGEAVAGAVARDAVLDPKRATVDGRDGLQPFVPLVCGLERGRGSLGRNDLHQEPRPVAGGGGGQEVSGIGSGASTGQGSDLG